MTISLYEQAVSIALHAHRDQVRKNDGSPYIVHPLSVANMLARVGMNEEVVAAAVVHDVLEDTAVTQEELLEKLGPVVTTYVVALSEDKNLDWHTRKQNYIQNVTRAGEPVWAISVADKIHNAESLLVSLEAEGEVVWTKFNKGKEDKMWFENELYTALSNIWEHELLVRYHDLIVALENH